VREWCCCAQKLCHGTRLCPAYPLRQRLSPPRAVFDDGALPRFVPSVPLTVRYASDAIVDLGTQVLFEAAVRRPPTVSWPRSAADVANGASYYILMLDPDAPGPRKPSERSVLHWLLKVEVPLLTKGRTCQDGDISVAPPTGSGVSSASSSKSVGEGDSSTAGQRGGGVTKKRKRLEETKEEARSPAASRGLATIVYTTRELLSYAPPKPASGNHRYVFLLLRRRIDSSGSGGDGDGVGGAVTAPRSRTGVDVPAMLAAYPALEPVGVNFFCLHAPEKWGGGKRR
jgi:phosphatidylethanolamine-binding protein (PEBP) family uncharacterized protein